MNVALDRLPPLPRAQLPAEAIGDRLLSGLGTAVDSTVMRAMQFVVEQALIPDPSDLDALRRSASRMLEPDLQQDPDRYFRFLDQAPGETRARSHHARRIRGGAAYSCRIETDYIPFEETHRDDGATPIHVELWHHDRAAPRATVVALHGFTMGRPRVDAVVLMANAWYARGLDVALVTLPHHGARSGKGARFSGEPFASPDVGRLSEAVREAVFEIRQVVHWRREQTGAPVGLLGLSLGGYLAALTASLCDDLDFVVPIVPPVCIGDLAWRFFEHTQHHQRGGPAALSQTELRRSFRVHSPLAHRLRVAPERTLIVAGRGDRIVPPEHPAGLWEHWGCPAIHWFSGSHLAPFGRGAIIERVERHLRALDIL